MKIFKKDALFLGIDAGTTNIKLSLFNSSLEQVYSHSQKNVIYVPEPGASEIDMRELWDSLCLCSKTIFQNFPEAKGLIAGIGISGQGDGLWALDSNFNPVCNAILWNDTRSRCLNIDEIPGINELLAREYANTIFAGSMPAIQKWLKVYHNDIYSKINFSLHCKDWLNYKLTGKIISDYTDIHCSSGFNVKTKKYVPEIFELLDIREALKTMPELTESMNIIGYVTAEASLSTGLPIGIPVMAGCLDCCAASAGTNFFNKEQACSTIGTSMINEVIQTIDEVNPMDLNGLLLYHVVPKKYIKIMNTAGGSSCTDYIKDLICPEESFDHMFQNLEKIPIGSNGIIFHPYLFGERAPFKNPYAFASIFGLRNHHTRYDIMRAAYEGLAMSFMDCYQGKSGFNTILLSGGASKSPFICQMFCDAIGLRVQRQTIDELGALGIAKMLMITLGYADNFNELNLDSCITYHPDYDNHHKYIELYNKFIDYRDSIKPYWN